MRIRAWKNPPDTSTHPRVLPTGQASRIDNATIERVMRVLVTPPPKDGELQRTQVQRRRERLALDCAAGTITESDFLASVAALHTQESDIPQALAAVDAGTETRRLQDFAALWHPRTEDQRAGASIGLCPSGGRR